MVKRNAARHLLFAVSLLLFFFVYMGYRLRTSATTESEATPAAETVTQLVPAAESPAQLPVSAPPVAVPASKPPATALRPIPDAAVSLDDEEDQEAVEDLAGWVPSGSGENLKLSPPPSLPSNPASSGLRPSSPAATPHAGSITGLVPERLGGSAGSPSEPEGEDDDDEEEAGGAPELAAAPLSLPLPGGAEVLRPADTTKPAEKESGAAAFLPALPLDSTGDGAAAPQRVPPGGLPALPLPGLSESNAVEERSPLASAAAPGAGARAPSGLAPSAPATRPPPQLPPPRPVSPATPPQTPVSAGSPVTPGGLSGGERRGGESSSDSTRIYVIRPGDTLSNIAARELGSASLADNIFLFNRGVIIDPDQLMVGQKIKLPAQDSGGATVAALPQTPESPAPARRPTQGLGRVHRVARGDTLSSIAQQYYGSSSGWRFLYEANKSVVPDPNRLSVGTELSVPPYEQ